jgi:hypothetical protein
LTVNPYLKFVSLGEVSMFPYSWLFIYMFIMIATLIYP